MVTRERAYFELTIKGIDELSTRTYRLSPRVRNILFLIQKGTPTVEGILENTIFPREEVIENLRELLRTDFVSLHRASNPAASLTTITGSLDSTTVGASAATTSYPAKTPHESPQTEAPPPPPVYIGF
jgi:hypothetical protein